MRSGARLNLRATTRRVVRGIARVAVVATLGVAVLVALGYQAGAERHWLLALLQYLPYPVHLAPALLGLVAGLLLGRGWLLAALATLFIVVWPVMGFELPQREAADGRTRLRVLTWNIKAAHAAGRVGGFDRLAGEIARHDPDVIVLQEAGQPSRRHQVEPVVVASLLGARERQTIGQFVFASRHPLRDCQAAQLPAGVPGEVYARCTIRAGGLDIDLYAVHLQTPRVGLDAAWHLAPDGIVTWQENIRGRLSQADALVRDLARGTRPAILAGDFNAPQTSLTMRGLRESGLRNAFDIAGFGYGYTYGQVLIPGFAFTRIDHILASPGIGVASATVGSLEASPHGPVIADLLLPAPPSGATLAPEDRRARALP